MKISEVIKAPVVEGGNAFDQAGPVHISEIEPTLAYVGKISGIDDVMSRTLGSTGKKEYSGDIDIAVPKMDKLATTQFMHKLKDALGDENVRKIGKLVTTIVPIQGYNETNNQGESRTGYVQVDFVPGDLEWLKLFYYSPTSEQSNLKGTHRNIAIATIARFLDRDESEQKDDYGRPVSVVRWKWSSSTGLVKVIRKSRRGKDEGKWLKTRKDEALSDPITDPDKIASILFMGKETAEVLNSAESLIQAVQKHYPPKTAEAIFAKMAENFSNHYDIGPKQWSYPNNISKYLDK